MGYEEADKLGVFEASFMDFPSSRHILPVRELPSRFYDFRRTVSPTGSHFATVWKDFGQGSLKLVVKANEFGRSSGLFEKFNVKELSGDVVDSPLVVTIQKGGKEFFIDQLGIGLSQVAPVLAEVILVTLLVGLLIDFL